MSADPAVILRLAFALCEDMPDVRPERVAWCLLNRGELRWTDPIARDDAWSEAPTDGDVFAVMAGRELRLCDGALNTVYAVD